MNPTLEKLDWMVKVFESEGGEKYIIKCDGLGWRSERLVSKKLRKAGILTEAGYLTSKYKFNKKNNYNGFECATIDRLINTHEDYYDQYSDKYYCRLDKQLDKIRKYVRNNRTSEIIDYIREYQISYLRNFI